MDPNLLKKIQNMKPGQKTTIKTWSRDSTITPEMVGLTFGVHNGRQFIEVFVTEDMVGYKLGSFSPTRKFTIHGSKMAKEEAAAAADVEKAKLAAVQADTTAKKK